MRLAFAGTADFAALVLSGLLASHHDIVVALTTPDRPRGRHGTPQPSPLKRAALAAGLPVLQPARPDDPATMAALQAATIEAVVVCAYGVIIRRPLLDQFLVVVAHPSAVPRWRGPAPVVRALMAGETTLGVATLRMTAGVDEGPVGDLRMVDVPADADAAEAYRLLAGPAAASLLATLARVTDGTIEWRPQTGEPTYAAKIAESDRAVDWSRPAKVVVDQVRALSPGIGAHTTLLGRRTIIWRARALAQPPSAQRGERLVVAAGQGWVELLEVQQENRRRMSAADYLRGAGRALTTQ
jgi:methionyl-tRNA formyltransferase